MVLDDGPTLGLFHIFKIHISVGDVLRTSPTNPGFDPSQDYLHRGGGRQGIEAGPETNNFMAFHFFLLELSPRQPRRVIRLRIGRLAQPLWHQSSFEAWQWFRE